jgi:hydrogenase 3 maturation protease
MPKNPQDLKQELSKILLGNVLIVGIGNEIRGDDAFGPELIKRIDKKIKAQCLDVGSSPENYIGKIVKLKPDVILFVDSASMEEEPGTAKLIGIDEIPQYGFSTHNMSPKLMIDNINNQLKTNPVRNGFSNGVNIFMLGVQPKSLEFGEPLSRELENSLTLLTKIFIGILGRNE